MRFIVALLAIGVMSAACGGAGPTASALGPSTAPGTAPTAPGTPGPTTAPTSAGATDGAASSVPSPVPDTTLEAAFPDQIDGQPVTHLSSLYFLSALQSGSTPQEDIDAFIAAMQSIGVNPASVSFGSAYATVGGAEVYISALRVPGGSAAAVVDQITRLSGEDPPPTVTAGTLGGKQVSIATDSNGGVDYYYFNGEYAWTLYGDEAQAAVVLAALP